MVGLVFDRSVPVYDPVQLMELAHQAGEITTQRFLHDYLGLLPRRQERILEELANGDVEEAMDAILSLRVTSAMVGALRLSAYCQHLQDQLTRGNIADMSDVTTELAVLVAAFVRAVNGK